MNKKITALVFIALLAGLAGGFLLGVLIYLPQILAPQEEMITPKPTPNIDDLWVRDPTTGVYSWSTNEQVTMQTAGTDSLVTAGAPSYDISFGQLELLSGTGSGNYTCLKPGPSWENPAKPLSHQSELVFGAIVKASSVDNVKEYILCGTWFLGPEHAFGFKIQNNQLFGYTVKSNNESTVFLHTISANVNYLLEAHYYPNDRVDFFVNRIYKSAVTTNLPGDDMSLFTTYVGTLDGSQKILTIQNMQIGKVG